MKHCNKLYILFFSFTIFSCVVHRDYRYLIPNNDQQNKDTITFSAEHKDYILQPGDIVDIKVSSNIPSDIEIFNRKFNSDNLNGNASVFASYFNGYIIDSTGNVDIPLIGKVKGQGLTCSRLNDTLKSKLAEYINFASVTTKLSAFRVTILGEVTLPGTKDLVNQYNLNIYQAIGLAGDITDIGNKQRVKLIRKNGQKVEVVKLDLSNISMIGSKYYYLQPNDVIYVEPLKAKVIRSNSSNIALALSGLTFIIVLINYLSK